MHSVSQGSHKYIVDAIRFSSHVCRGRGVLVAPGSIKREASGGTNFCRCNNYKASRYCLFEILNQILNNMGICKWIFKQATKMQNIII